MKKRYTEAHIIGILKEASAGMKTPALCYKYGISEATLYNWKTRFAGMTEADVVRVKLLEKENRRLKRLLADATSDNATLKNLLSQKLADTHTKREIVRSLKTDQDMAVSRACNLVGLSRTFFYYEPKRQMGPGRS